MIEDGLGWVCLHRRLLEWEWFTEPKTLQLFIFCLLRANHKTNKWRGYEIKRGQFISTLDELESKTGMSEQMIRTRLNRLVNASVITNKSTNKYRIITICNYDNYQLLTSTNEQTTQQAANSQITSEQQAANSQITPNNNDKNINNDNSLEHTQDGMNFFSPASAHVNTSVCERARKFLDWVENSIPAVQQMEEPFTEQQAQWLVSRYQAEDIKRIVTDFYNKKKTEQNKSAYATFTGFAARDIALKEKKQSDNKLYTYTEIANLQHAGINKMSDFRQIEVAGEKCWQKITDFKT